MVDLRLVACASLLTVVLSTACGGPIEDEPSVSVLPPEDGVVAGTVGLFLYRHQTQSGAVFETALSASFQSGEGDSCTTVTEGSCTRQTCLWKHPSAQENQIHAGRITATSGEHTLSVEPEESGPYRVTFNEGQFWQDAGAIVVEASGAMIPPFRVELQGPAETIVAEPPPPSPEAKLLMNRTSPFLLTWQASKVGKMMGVLSYQNGAEYANVTCTYPALSGEGLIPAELLADFNPNESTMRLSIGIGQSQLVDAGGWLIDVVAYTSATTASSGDASYSVRFE